LAIFVTVKIWDCHGNRLRAGPAVLKALTEAWTGTSLMERCGRIVIFPDENPGTSGVRSPDEHSNESRMTLCRSGSSGAVRVSSEGTRFLTMAAGRPAVNAPSCTGRRGRSFRPTWRLAVASWTAYSASPVLIHNGAETLTRKKKRWESSGKWGTCYFSVLAPGPTISNCLQRPPVRGKKAYTRPYSTPLHTAKFPVQSRNDIRILEPGAPLHSRSIDKNCFLDMKRKPPWPKNVT